MGAQEPLGKKHMLLTVVNHYFNSNTSLILRIFLNEGVYINKGIKNVDTLSEYFYS